MKKLLSLGLCLALAASLLTGCSSNLPKGYDPFDQNTSLEAEPTPAVPVGGLKTGLAVSSNAGSSKAAAGGENGLAQLDSSVVAVLVDANGVIVDCKIDGVQSKIDFDATGKLLTPIDTKFLTKQERGTDYGMVVASSIGKEWNEQATALANYVIGKTVDEVKGIAVDESTKPTDAELASAVTFAIGGYIPLIEKAVTTAQDLGAQAGDKLGLGISTNMSKSKDASADGDGLAQAYSMYTAASFDASGKITSCILDGSQSNVEFDTKGAITSSLTEGFATKNELKEEYGMKGASGIGLEWYEQAANYAAYATGKTVAQLQGVAVDESGHAAGADLTSSVTISIGEFNVILAKAADNAGVPIGTADGGALRLGLAVSSNAGSSKAAEGGENGLAQLDSSVVAVLVDANGVIVDCKIDGVQSKIDFDATGKLLTPIDTKFLTKQERGTDYGMVVASSIGKEWNEQATALANYVIGKTVDEVKGIAVDESTKPTDAELASSVTFAIGGYIPLIEKAVTTAQDLGAQAGDKLGLGISTNMSKSKDASADGDGLAQAYSMYTAASFDASGKITSCILDGSQSNVEFDTKGAITTSLTDGFATKNELKEAYGMKKASSIGYEWYEQAANFAQYVVGKTAAEVGGVAVDESGHATGPDLIGSVTVSIGDFQEILMKASENAGPFTGASGGLKTGLAVSSNAGSSKAAEGGENGLAQLDSSVVAVLVDANGVIVDCKIDGVQSKIDFDVTGKLLTPTDTEFLTKQERGTDYGMVVASSIGKEWNEQATALANYVIGKTVDEVKGIAVDESTKPTDAELASSVTFAIGGYIPLIEKAVTTAQDLGAQAGDKLGLGISTNMSKSKDASADGDGLAQAYSMYTAASFDASGKITSCILDGSQSNVGFDTKGAITTSLTDGFATKNELKEEYGMKGASGIGYEWYEQAANFAQYVVGKTAAEVGGIAVDDGGHATGPDLMGSVTVSIGDFQEILAKAAADAS